MRRGPHARGRYRPVDFHAIADAALRELPTIARRWLPNGKRCGHEYVALNPSRADRHLGSFKINLRSGRWADFATGARGGDAISLAAYLFGLKQVEAARKVAIMIGIAAETRK